MLTYQGGGVLESVKVTPVFYNSQVLYQKEITTFLKALVSTVGAHTENQFMNFLGHEYSTAQQRIKYGQVLQPYVGRNTAMPATTREVELYLVELITKKKVAYPVPGNIYAVHFPPGVTNIAFNVSSDGVRSGVSCVDWCAANTGFEWNGIMINYYMVPDPATCGCSIWEYIDGADPLGDLKSTEINISHEVAELITDPVQLGNGADAWRDGQGNQIGDYCAYYVGTEGVTLGDGKKYFIQHEYSNPLGICVAPAIPTLAV